MTTALQIIQGRFGRAALLDIDQGLIAHAHPHCHVLIKMGGADSAFTVRGRTCPLTDHSMVLVNAWEQHAYTPRPGAGPTLILALYIEPDWLAGLDRAFRPSGQPGFFPFPVASVTRSIRPVADRLATALGDGTGLDGQVAALADLMAAVIAPYARHRGAASGLSFRDYRIRKALRHMRHNMGQAFTLEDVARQSGLSRAQLFRGFRSDLGITPKLYFNSLRMETAVACLAEDEDRLAAVAERLGFSMQCHFTRFFRANLGITPSQYRRIVRLEEPMSGIGLLPPRTLALTA